MPASAGEPPDLAFATTETIRYQRPELPPLSEIARYYALSEEARFYSNGGPCHAQLTARLARYVGGDVSCLPVSNCTIGLIIALREIFGEPTLGRALIATPSFTFAATACAVRWAGFQPLFVDVDERAWQLDPEALGEALDAHPGEVAGVLGCSTFGCAPPATARAAWRHACERHGIALLIDSAAGFGAVDARGQRLGGFGDTEVFSFHATKPFAIGEGGAIVTGDPALADRFGQLANFGLDPVRRVSMVPGLNAKMAELQAATALAMLDRYDATLERRRATARALQQRLAHHPLTYQAESDGSTWQGFQVLVPDLDTRERALALSRSVAVEARSYFDPPLHRHPAFAAAPRHGSLAVTERIAQRTLSLPMANTLGERQIERIAGLLDRVFEQPSC